VRVNPWFAFPVIAAGVAGALIGRSVAEITCTPVDVDTACDAPEVLFAIVGAVVAVVGVAIVSVLVIRSLAEWRALAKRADEES